MRVFVICLQTDRKYDGPATGFWRTYFKGGIEEAGHEFLEPEGVDWVESLAFSDVLEPAAQREAAENAWALTLRRLQELHRERPVDLLLSYVFPQQVIPSAVAQVRDLGIPTVNFFCDNVREFRRVPEVFRAFDLHWVPEHKALDMYRRAGLEHLAAPMPVWIPQKYRDLDFTEDHPPTFIGRRDLLREQVMADVLRQGVEVRLHGFGWHSSTTRGGSSTAAAPRRATSPVELLRRQAIMVRRNGPASLYFKFLARKPKPLAANYFDAQAGGPVEDFLDHSRRARVSIGINRYPSLRHSLLAPDTYSRARDIEAPMTGCCYLTEWTEGLDEYYDLGTEIETWKTPEELAEKIRELEADAGRRRELRENGQRRALADHTIGRTIGRLARHLGIDKP